MLLLQDLGINKEKNMENFKPVCDEELMNVNGGFEIVKKSADGVTSFV